jgi:hypothetical protein
MAAAAARKAILPLAGWAYARKVSEYRFTFAPEGRPSSAGSPWWLNDTVG